VGQKGGGEILIDLNSIIGQIGRDKGIDRSVLIEAVESAMLSAAKKHFGHNLNLETKFNPDTGELEVVQFKTVVDRVFDPGTQVGIQDARRDFDSEAMVGDEFGRKLNTGILGRIAAQTAKQVILQKVRDAERGVIYEEFKNSKGDLINGIVQRYDRGNVIVNLGRTEAILPKREQINRERYRQGDRIRCLILDIDRSARGPQIVLSRSHPEFLKKLFELEVPEILDRTIEIKAVAREPGDRAKIAVISSDPSVDPVGACVGVKGVRVQAVVQELRGERIDIVTWTGDEPSFVARSLAPAEVSRVVVDEEAHSMEVVVNDDQLSLAIGRKGQNVKLASKLTGWRIDVRSVSVADEETRRARRALESIPGLAFTEAEQLFQEGYRSVLQLSQASPDDLLSIEGMTEERASTIIDNAREFYESNPELHDAQEGEGHELKQLQLADELLQKVVGVGFRTPQQLLVAEGENSPELGGLTEDERDTLRMAIDGFLKKSSSSKLLAR
jgi:transcription termination/antitermination protein NusA